MVPKLMKLGRSRNSALLVGDSMVRLGAALAVSVVVARVYGPSGFGAINTAIALSTLVLGSSALGLSGLLVKEFVLDPAARGTLMRSVTAVKFALGLLLYSVMVAAVVVGGGSSAVAVVAIVGAGFLSTCLDPFEADLTADEKFRQLVICHIVGIVIASAVKLMIAYLGLSITWLAVAYALDYVLLYLLPAFYFLSRLVGDRNFGLRYQGNFDVRPVFQLIRRSWPVMLSGVLAQVNLRIDALMIAAFLSFADVGVYSAAGRLSEAWPVLAMALVTAVFPQLVRQSVADRDAFGSGIVRIFRLLIWSSLLGAVVIAVLSGVIIDFIYGREYAASATVLAVHVFGGVFLFIRTAVSRWLIIENLMMFSLISHAFGALVNIVGNALFLRDFGVIAAAAVAVVSYASSGLLFLLFTRRTRVMLRIILLAVFPGHFLDTKIRSLVDELPSATASSGVTAGSGADGVSH